VFTSEATEEAWRGMKQMECATIHKSQLAAGAAQYPLAENTDISSPEEVVRDWPFLEHLHRGPGQGTQLALITIPQVPLAISDCLQPRNLSHKPSPRLPHSGIAGDQRSHPFVGRRADRSPRTAHEQRLGRRPAMTPSSGHATPISASPSLAFRSRSRDRRQRTSATASS